MKTTSLSVYITLFLFLLLQSASLAQDVSTQGKEFWVSFMFNGYEDGNQHQLYSIQLTISAKHDCNCTVSNPVTGWTTNEPITAGQTKDISIPKAEAYHPSGNSETVSNYGIKVEATDTISVYNASIATNSFDASYVLPIQSLGSDYIIQSGPQSITPGGSSHQYQNETSAILIVATQDNTIVEITPSVRTLGNRPADQTYTIELDAGQTYQVRSNRNTNQNSQRDLSGTRVKALDCKKIAVYNGNTLTRMPIDNNQSEGFDHIFEQAMPLKSWGKEFVVTQSKSRHQDIVKITSSADGNTIMKNGIHAATLNEGESYSFSLHNYDGSCYIETTKPSAVYLYNTSSYDDSSNGDPSMVWIAPIEQRIDEMTFSTFHHPQAAIDAHYVNIIVKTEDISHVYFDGTAIESGLFQPVNGNADYSYAQYNIENHGTHSLLCENGFNAHVYGFGERRGYAYLVGSNAIDLNVSLIINGEPISQGGSIRGCVGQEMEFNAWFNYDIIDLTWDFDDGTPQSHESHIMHAFNEERVYHASISITTTENGCEGDNMVTIPFIVDLTRHNEEEHDVICAHVPYSGFGFEDIVAVNDTLLTRGLAFCHDSLYLHLTVLNYDTVYHEQVCWEGVPDVYRAHGFEIEYDTPNKTYTERRPYISPEGCEGIITLELSVSEKMQFHVPKFACDSLLWHDSIFIAPTLYIDTITNPTGCDSIITLELTMNYTPDIRLDTYHYAPSHWVLPSIGSFTPKYVFSLFDDNLMCEWDTVVWQLSFKESDTEVPWFLIPDENDFRKCNLFVTNYLTDTVWLTAIAQNECAPDGVNFDYWMVSSYYGVNEDSYQAAINIMPNPNDGEMRLVFENMEGPVAISIYNALGLRVDSFTATASYPNTSLPYSSRNLSDGVYYFVITHKGQNITKKVVIIR